MNVEFRLPGRDHLGRVFLTWTPVEARVRVANPTGTAAVPVTLRNGGAAGGGRVTFSVKRMGTRSSSLALDLPVSGAWVSFFVAGEFGRPSVSLGDAVIEALGSGSLGLLGTRRVTVRIREGRADSFRGRARSLPRRLRHVEWQRRRPLPRFPRHARERVRARSARQCRLPALASRLSPGSGTRASGDRRARDASLLAVRPAGAQRLYARVHGCAERRRPAPVQPRASVHHVATDGALGITRTPLFNTANAPPGLLTEQQTINLGGPAATASYANFGALEGNPHGSAHVSFTGFIRSLPIAARDPLFFLLHCNVDRLWAKWQWIRKRTSSGQLTRFRSTVSGPRRASPP